jgi:hypothetical protein
MPLPPSRDRGPRRNKEIDKRHSSTPHPNGALQKMVIGSLKTMENNTDQPCETVDAMRGCAPLLQRNNARSASSGGLE